MPFSINSISRRYDWRLVGSLVLVMLLLAFAVFMRLILLGHVTDDAYITYRYVDRLVGGQGLTFNDGEWVEGFSNPLWLLLLAGLKIITGWPTPLLGKLLGLACFIGFFAALWGTARAFPTHIRLPLFWFAAAWLLLTPGIEIYATLGLEGPLLAMLLMAGVALTLHAEFNRPGALLLAAACFGLVGITRPEGPLYGLLWGGTLAAHWFRAEGVSKDALKWLALLGLITALPAGLYQLWRLEVYYLWVPNTAIAKPPGIFQGSWLFDLWGPWLAALLPLALIALTPRGAAPPMAALRRYVWAAGGPLLAGLLFNLYSGADWMLFGRFLTPVFPLLALGLMAIILLRARTIPMGLLLLGLLASALSWQGPVRDYVANHGMAPMLMRGHDQKVAGEWLARHFPAPRTVAIWRLGAVSYYNPQHTVWDLFGLTDAAEARYFKEQRNLAELAATPVMQRQPDLVVISTAPLNANESAYPPSWRTALADYVCLRQFPQGDHGTLDLWLKKGLEAPVKPECRPL